MASIHSAAYNGKVNSVRALLNSGTNVNARGVTGITPLHYAAGHGFLPMVKLLLDRGANINARDKYGITPLILAAAQKCNLAVIRELLDRGANINARNKENFSALMYAASPGEYNRRNQVQVVNLLLDRGANKTGFSNIKRTNTSHYTTSTNKLSVLKNKPGVKRPPVPENLSKVEQVEHYLRNINPNKIKLNVSNTSSKSAKKIKLTYLINGRNAGNATAIVPMKIGLGRHVEFGEGATHKDFRGRGVGTLLRALLTKAVLKSGYNRIQHQGVNMENRAKTRPSGNRGIPTSAWILRTRLGFKKIFDNHRYHISEFTKNNNQSKINSILRNAGLNF
jgi:hypothetical protein